MMLKYVILVLYNTRLEDSRSFRSLSLQDICMVLVDNSTDEQIQTENEKAARQYQMRYINMHGNHGLSKAYNRAVDLLSKEEGYVLMADDDTDFPKDFVQRAKAQIHQTLADVYLPIVRAGQHILSPCQMHRGIVSEAKDIYALSLDEITGINSGMILSLRVFDKVRYNDRLFLDYVDHDFIRSLKRIQAHFQILPIELKQSFSVFSDSRESSIQRLRILKNDLDVFYGSSWIKHWILAKRKLRHILHFKDLSVLWKG